MNFLSAALGYCTVYILCARAVQVDAFCGDNTLPRHRRPDATRALHDDVQR